MNQEIIDLTQRLLDSIANGDWETYEQLCDPSLTCFEPEANGHLVNGMSFHKFYFDNRPVRPADRPAPPRNTSISAPNVRMIGDNVAVISYVRLVQRMHPRAGATTRKFEETRVWEKQNGQWQHVHFHRSQPGGNRNKGRGKGMKMWKRRGRHGHGDCHKRKH